MSAGNGPVPFKQEAAQHRESLVQSFDWSSGRKKTLRLDNVGYLNEGHLILDLTMDVTTTGTVTDADAAQSNFFPFIGLRSPQGEQVWSTNSRDIFDKNYMLDKAVNPTSDPSHAAWSPSTAGNQSLHLHLRIPVALNNKRNFDFGMLMRQISNNQFMLDLQMANPSDLVGSGTCVVAISGTVTWEETYYDAVEEGSNVTPPNFAQYIRRRSQLEGNALVKGSNDVKYDCGPVLIDTFHRLINNGTADATISDLSYIQVKANKGNEIENRTGERMAYDQTMHLGQALRSGVYRNDYQDDTDNVNETTARDFINSNMASQLDFFIQFNGTPAGTAQIESYYDEIVTLGA